jgi:cell division GTPase FtsZ
MEPSTQWTVIACLGGVSGTMLYLSIAAYMAGKQNEVRFKGTMPFEFEGIKRRRNAQVVIDYVSSLHSQRVVLLEQIKKCFDPCPLVHLFDTVNEEMFAMLNEWFISRQR